MIRRRTLRFAFAGALMSAGLSLSLEASSQAPPAPADPAPSQPAQPPPSPPPAPAQPAQPAQPPQAAPSQPAQPPPADPAQPAQPPPPANPAPPAQPAQPPQAVPAQPLQPAPAPVAPAPAPRAQPTPSPVTPAPRLQLMPGSPVHAMQLAPPAPAPAPAPVTPAPAQPPPSPYAPTMQAGGLAPPPPIDEKTANTPSTPTPPQKTEEEDEDDKDKDSGRGLSWVWLNVEGGFQHVGLQTFNIDEENFTAGFIETTATGGAIGVGLGARLLFLTIGARGRLGLLDAWQYFTVGGELGFRFPLGNFEPHFELGGGYAAVGSFSDSVLGDTSAEVSIRGFYARPSAGLDYFISPYFSVGASASWEFTAMTRPGLSPTAITEIEQSPTIDNFQRQKANLLALEGSGYGSAVTITGVLGLHF